MTAAAAWDYRSCIQGDEYAGGTGDCSFSINAQRRRRAVGVQPIPTVTAVVHPIDRNRCGIVPDGVSEKFLQRGLDRK